MEEEIKENSCLGCRQQVTVTDLLSSLSGIVPGTSCYPLCQPSYSWLSFGLAGDHLITRLLMNCSLYTLICLITNSWEIMIIYSRSFGDLFPQRTLPHHVLLLHSQILHNCTLPVALKCFPLLDVWIYWLIILGRLLHMLGMSSVSARSRCSVFSQCVCNSVKE